MTTQDSARTYLERLRTGDGALCAAADEYIETNWDQIKADLADLVAVESVEGEHDPAVMAPFGPGPREALTRVLQKACDYGFDTADCDGYVGVAEAAGEAGGGTLGIIGHMDVVPAGDGWNTPPFELTEHDGYLLGRGTTDDKGPMVAALHAARFWADAYAAAGAVMPHGIRLIFGCNEESGMADVRYYLERYPAPEFTFSPDADFPLCYGEKGRFAVEVVSEDVLGGSLLELNGGTVPNGVPSGAYAVVCADEPLPAADRIAVEEAPEVLCQLGVRAYRVSAAGVSAHAATPAGGVSAIHVLVDYLLEHLDLSADQRTWLSLVQRICSATDGRTFDIHAHDDDFGALTMVGGIHATEGRSCSQTIDIRFPATVDSDELLRVFQAEAAKANAIVRVHDIHEVFLADKESAPVQALLSAYELATGNDPVPFTMGGNTYACHFPAAVSFGAKDPAFPLPDWVGHEHMANEGIAVAEFKQALKVYIVAIGKIMDVSLR